LSFKILNVAANLNLRFSVMLEGAKQYLLVLSKFEIEEAYEDDSFYG